VAFLWLVPCLPLALLPLFVGSLLTGSWMALRVLRSPMAIDASVPFEGEQRTCPHLTSGA